MQIQQSEWFLIKFIPAKEERKAYSEVLMEIHLGRSNLPYRLVVKGKLGIEWEEQLNGSDLPVPNIIDASEIQLLEHVGKPAFKRITKVLVDVPVVDPSIIIQPLVVFDVNHDRLPEILIGGCNFVL